ncbi:MAG: hypothetical protein GYB64_17025, partial [Chloroflexi bacterium]|nr:hypothetical protein [Chloroflexota bacterium]
LGLNLSISGELWPNTFFAKQTEYSVLWQQPYPLRFVQQIGVSLVGAHVLLIPALIAALVRQIRQRPLDVLYFLPLIWVVLHWAVYAARLPVVYQHGRYAIPTIPLIVIYGVRGAAELVRLRSRSQLVRAASVGYIAAVLVAFPAVTVFLGAPAYAADVHFIEEDIADAARWIAAERSDATIVAAHDIGALGYYAPGPLLDLAGLVSPEVVPFMLDGERLAEYVVSEGADYLMVFPQWNAAYETLVEDDRFCPVWTSADEDGTSPAAERLGPKTIYRVEPGGCP